MALLPHIVNPFFLEYRDNKMGIYDHMPLIVIFSSQMFNYREYSSTTCLMYIRFKKKKLSKQKRFKWCKWRTLTDKMSDKEKDEK